MRPYEVTRTPRWLKVEEVQDILNSIDTHILCDWRYEIVEMDLWSKLFGIRIGVHTIDRDTGSDRWQYGRTWWVEPVHDEADVIRTVFLGILTLFEHEARELYTVNGKKVFEPHAKFLDPDSLFQDI